ncbi:hypothetical protein SLEP1_g3723 [Rubroshorea leprosula]|uniref:Response regulatory domain-containing protein n=1 Tax=Rubroshorea leprosula TaxID=152421 RepID=A0AAV5HSE7_9ROSI|nr:hypothetical protein SLEP1_g3723 [Rubroshorea leprosula]
MSESISSTNALKETTSWQDDVFSKVKGSDKKGRVRCLRKVLTSKKSIPSTVANYNVEERLSEVENMLSGLMQLMKARFSDENITDILQVANQLSAVNRLDREVLNANSGQGFSPNNHSSSQPSHHLLSHQNERSKVFLGMNLSNRKGSISMASPSAYWRAGDGIPNQFPVGLRVLVVDDYPTCLVILEKMLRKCLYEGRLVFLTCFSPLFDLNFLFKMACFFSSFKDVYYL